MAKWSVVYKSSGFKSGRLLFPERLTREFLEEQRRIMGSYLFANQYENEVIPEDEKRFKPHWIRYYSSLPAHVYYFAFIDPAIGQKDHNDYTGVVVCAVDCTGTWYVVVANRYRLTPTEIVDKMFEIHQRFKCMGIGVESVAYQEALVYLAHEEMLKRKITLPLKDISTRDLSKQTRILALVPRFEWGTIFLNQGLIDLEDELQTFPRGKWDDLIDSLSSLEELVHYPLKEEPKIERPASPNHPDYERWYIQQVAREGVSSAEADGGDNGDY